MKKELKKLSRPELNVLAAEKFSIVDADKLATKNDVIAAILAADKEVIIDLPSYKSTKKVKALEIEKIVRNPRKHNGTAIFTPKDKDYPAFMVDRHFMKTHQFKIEEGGFYLIFEDGSNGFMQNKAFTEEFKKK